MNNFIYSHADFFLVRSPYWSIEKNDEISRESNWIEYLINLAKTDHIFREAIFIASASLYNEIKQEQVKNKKKIALSILKYALRMSYRTVPFGLFSFASIGRFTSETNCRYDLSQVYKCVRPDMNWIYQFIDSIYQDQLLFVQLPIKTNPLIQSSFKRYYLDFVRGIGEDETTADRRRSIKKSPIIDMVFAIANEAMTVSNLYQEINQKFKNCDEENILPLIFSLLKQQFLFPCLTPSILSKNPFEKVMEKTPTECKAYLQEVSHSIQNYSSMALGSGENHLVSLHEKMNEKVKVNCPLQVDTAYPSFSLSLGIQIAKDLENGINAFYRISRQQFQSIELKQYHEQFIRSYGTHQLVPLIDLIDERKGLGSLYSFSSHSQAFQKKPSRHRIHDFLLTKWQEAMRENNDEIVLSEKDIDLLAIPDLNTPLPTIEVYFNVVAASQEEINQKKYKILVQAINANGGGAIGRFAHPLGKSVQDSLESFYKLEQLKEENSRIFGLAFTPKINHISNVALHPPFRPGYIEAEALCKMHEGLSVNDIYVGATPERLFLTTKDQKYEIIGRYDHAVNPTYAPLALFHIHQISLSRYTEIKPLDLTEVIATAIFSPRISFKNIIFSAAKWQFSPSHFIHLAETEMLSKFTMLADQWSLPRQCLFGQEDMKLLVDRTNLSHLELILQAIKNKMTLRFSEYFQTSWIASQTGHHNSEFVLPFIRNQVVHSNIPHLIAETKSEELDETLLGDKWLYLQLYLVQEDSDYFLIELFYPFLAQIVKEIGIKNWFFVRYYDPKFHLRIRIQFNSSEGCASSHAFLNKHLKKWIGVCCVQDAKLSSYNREIARYGGKEIINEAENVFCADSVTALNMINERLKNNHPLSPPVFFALAGYSFLDSSIFQDEVRKKILVGESINKMHLANYRKHESLLVKFSQELNENHIISQELKIFVDATKVRRIALQEYLNAVGEITPYKLHNVIDSMLHMHFNRLGCSVEEENAARAYAAQILKRALK